MKKLVHLAVVSVGKVFLGVIFSERHFLGVFLDVFLAKKFPWACPTIVKVFLGVCFFHKSVLGRASLEKVPFLSERSSMW